MEGDKMRWKSSKRERGEDGGERLLKWNRRYRDKLGI
jgi:hypothetical protein